jgi:hypothetical protein
MPNRTGHDTQLPGRRVVPLYTIVDKRHGKAYEVVLWVGYGAVAPTLWTTNGSVLYVARLTAEYVNSGFFEIQDSKLETDFTDARALRAAIQHVCEAVDLEAGG